MRAPLTGIGSYWNDLATNSPAEQDLPGVGVALFWSFPFLISLFQFVTPEAVLIATSSC